MGKGPRQTFLQRRDTDGQQVCEKVLNITNHQRNAIKTTVRYHLTTVRMAKLLEKQKMSAAEGVEKREPLCTVSGNVNWCSRCGEQCGGSLIQFLGLYPKELKSGPRRDTCPPMSTAALFTVAKHGHNLNVHRQMNVRFEASSFVKWPNQATSQRKLGCL